MKKAILFLALHNLVTIICLLKLFNQYIPLIADLLYLCYIIISLSWNRAIFFLTFKPYTEEQIQELNWKFLKISAQSALVSVTWCLVMGIFSIFNNIFPSIIILIMFDALWLYMIIKKPIKRKKL